MYICTSYMYSAGWPGVGCTDCDNVGLSPVEVECFLLHVYVCSNMISASLW